MKTKIYFLCYILLLIAIANCSNVKRYSSGNGQYLSFDTKKMIYSYVNVSKISNGKFLILKNNKIVLLDSSRTYSVSLKNYNGKRTISITQFNLELGFVFASRILIHTPYLDSYITTNNTKDTAVDISNFKSIEYVDVITPCGNKFHVPLIVEDAQSIKINFNYNFMKCFFEINVMAPFDTCAFTKNYCKCKYFSYQDSFKTFRRIKHHAKR